MAYGSLKQLYGHPRGGRPQGIEGLGKAGLSHTSGSSWPPLAIRTCVDPPLHNTNQQFVRDRIAKLSQMSASLREDTSGSLTSSLKVFAFAKVQHFGHGPHLSCVSKRKTDFTRLYLPSHSSQKTPQNIITLPRTYGFYCKNLSTPAQAVQKWQI
jgi:hypothetical protein